MITFHKQRDSTCADSVSTMYGTVSIVRYIYIYKGWERIRGTIEWIMSIYERYTFSTVTMFHI